jgi:hypothetical protein
MTFKQIASPATIHRKLELLREIGMVETEFVGSNRHTKYLVPTPFAYKYFNAFSQLMQRALKTS